MTTNRPGSCVDGSARSRWTDAHAEAARFLGECFGAGALLGTLVAMGRVRREDGDARRPG